MSYDRDMVLEELNDGRLFTLSTGRTVEAELVEEDDKQAVLKYELIDDDTYNGVFFSQEDIQYQYDQFKKMEFDVSHGLDHSRESLDQIGDIVDMELKKDGAKLRCFITSRWLKGSYKQDQAHILRKQGKMKYISGGWSGKITFNEEKGRFEIKQPVLREVSSTPTPAKRDAKVQEALDFILSLNHSPKDIEMEDNVMTEKDQEIKPSPEGKGVSEQENKLATLESEYKAQIEAIKTERAEMKARNDADIRAGLIGRAKELGLSEEQFKDVPNAAIETALKVAKEMQVKLLQEREPENQFGGEGNAGLKDGSVEMALHLEKTVFNWGKLDEEATL